MKIPLQSSRGKCSFSQVLQSLPLSGQLPQPNQQLRQTSTYKKIPRWRKKANATKKGKQMSESLQPTVSNVSHGGQFEISAADNNQPSTNQWKKAPSEDGSKGSSSKMIPENFRTWEKVSNYCHNITGPSFRFKVVSYNVLAQVLLEIHPYLYSECYSNDLKWKVRADRIYNEIVSLAPDIICFQEVQASHLNSFYERFEQIGYSGVFKRKTGSKYDGCAIYFKKAIFQLMDQCGVEFLQPQLPILNRDNVGLMVKLVANSAPESPFIVATTHLLYNPKRTDVRLAQLQMLLAEIDRFAYFNNGRTCGHLPIILTGDFNSTPDSAVVRLLDIGQVNAAPFRDISDWRNVGITDYCQHLSVYLSRLRGEPIPNYSAMKIRNSDYCSEEPTLDDWMDIHQYSELFNSTLVGYCLQLQSAYDRVKSDGRREATTFQDYWVTVDYIYFSRNTNLHLIERLRLPTAEECESLGLHLPNAVYGSDHLSLGAHFEIKPIKCSL